MIADYFRKGLDWARSFFWVSDSGKDDTGTAKSSAAKGTSDAAKSQRSSASGSTSTAQRRPAAAKTSTNKRGTGSSTRTAAKSGGAASKASTAKSGGKAAGAKSPAPKSTAPKSTTPKSTGPKSTGPGAPTADPATPGDLSEIKGIGPAMKTKLAQLGIKNFADLAGADANQVAKNLDQRTITPERVRSWIAEAKKRS
jgi:predicted flap endonuclease-1-like 5' DNA nuclease